MEGQNISFSQMMQAQEYVRAYIRYNGGNPFAEEWPDSPEKVPKFWPEDVKKAWEVVYLYGQNELKQGIIS